MVLMALVILLILLTFVTVSCHVIVLTESILVFSTTAAEHIEHWTKMLSIMHEHKLHLNPACLGCCLAVSGWR